MTLGPDVPIPPWIRPDNPEEPPVEVTPGPANPPIDEPVILKARLPPKFNPPLIRYASGSQAFAPMPEGTKPDDPRIPLRNPADRNRVLGPANEGLRVRQRGVIIQDLEHAAEWFIDQEPPTEEQEGPEVSWDGQTFPGDAGDGSGNTEDYEEPLPEDLRSLRREYVTWAKSPWKKRGSMLDYAGTTYGFRFHYNPSQVSQSAGYQKNVNIANIVSSRAKAVPITPPTTAGSVSLSLYLNRIEDMSYIKRRGDVWALPESAIGLYYGRDPNPTELEGIATRGTEYDLEFLFRTILGRPYPTKLRGISADIGLIWGTPVQLWLSRSMRYRGRVTGVSWTHTSFNRFMVPMWTQVQIQFERLPDITTAEQDANTVLNDGYGTSKVMGIDIIGPWQAHDSHPAAKAPRP